MRHFIKMEGEKVYLVGEAQLSEDSDCGVPYYEQDLSNGQVGQFPTALDIEESEELWDYIFVEGDEYLIESEL